MTDPLAFAAAALTSAIARRLRRLVVHDDHWRIGLRRRAEGDALLSGLDEIGAAPWRWLPDDRQRYFADPFLFEDGGVTYVFCEEFPYATGKGVISRLRARRGGQSRANARRAGASLSPLLSCRSFAPKARFG